MTTKLTHNEKWAAVEPALQRAGVDTHMLKPIMQAKILGQLETDEVIGSDDETWQEWVDEVLLSEKPQLATKAHTRMKHCKEIADNLDGNDFEAGDSVEEAGTKKWMVVIEDADRRDWFYGCNTYQEIADCYFSVANSDGVAAEWVESIYDLDTGERSGPNLVTKVETVVTINGEEFRG